MTYFDNMKILKFLQCFIRERRESEREREIEKEREKD